MPPPGTPRLVVVPQHRLRQVWGAVVARGPAFRDPDMAAFEVLVKLLGSQSSDAFAHVREEMGAAYSLGASFESYPDASMLTMRAVFEGDKALDGVQAMLDAIAAARSGVGPEALDIARKGALASWRATLATDEGMASMLGFAVLKGQPPEDAQAWPERLRQVTAEQLVAVARKYLDPAALHLVFVGHAGYLRNAKALGFGAPVFTDGFGRPLPKATRANGTSAAK
jgi:zinc protease